MEQLALGFDYSQLDTETRFTVQQRTHEIKSLMKRTAQDIIEIGQKLLEVKEMLGHGNFRDWLAGEFKWSIPTANRFMQVAQQFGDQMYQIDTFSPSALYLLASPSTPEPARQEAIEQAQNGVTITHAAAQEIVKQHKSNGFTYEQSAPAPEMRLVDTRPLYAADAHLDAALDDESKSVCTECGQVYDGAGCPDCTPKNGIKRCHTCSNLYDCQIFNSCPYCYKQNHGIVAGWVDGLPEMVNSKPHVTNNSGDNEWYTPQEYIEAARLVMGRIDLDPASSGIANEVVKAESFHDSTSDGLSQHWSGRIWMNPPYARELIVRFCEKLRGHYQAGDVQEAIVLVNNGTETKWFQQLAGVASALCLPEGRVQFWHPEKVAIPLQGQVILYLGNNPDLFKLEFRRFGSVWQSI